MCEYDVDLSLGSTTMQLQFDIGYTTIVIY